MQKYAIIICFIVVLIYYFQTGYTQVNDAGRDWNVSSAFSNSDAAAKLMSDTHSKIIVFLRYLKYKYHIDEADDVHDGLVEDTREITHSSAIHSPNDTYNIIDHLLDNYNPDVIYENDPRWSTDTSYTIDKGASMYVCLRDKQNPNQLVDPDIFMFVMLHEMSHIANYNGWGHEEDFWTVFKFILHEAVLSGIYKPVNYAISPVTYCGLKVDYSPLYNTSLRDLWVG